MDNEGQNMDNRSTIIDCLEIRRSKSFDLIPVIVMILGIFFCFLGYRQDMVDLIHTHFTIVQYFFLLVFLAMFVYPLIKLTDNKIKVKIDKDGIWTKKYGTIPWTEIWYVYSTERTERGMTASSLMIKLKESPENPEGKEIRIPLSALDKELNEIRPTLNYFTQSYGIYDLGHDVL